jgi:hypothetical protein
MEYVIGGLVVFGVIAFIVCLVVFMAIADNFTR